MKYVVASVDEIPSGGRKVVNVAGVSVGIFNLHGGYYALRNHCPHQGGPLCEGKVWESLESPVPGVFVHGQKGEIIACEWHGWEFDIRTGQSWCDPRKFRTKSYPVSVESGAVLVAEPDAPADGLVKGPYVAETYNVSTDGQYIVLEI